MHSYCWEVCRPVSPPDKLSAQPRQRTNAGLLQALDGVQHPLPPGVVHRVVAGRAAHKQVDDVQPDAAVLVHGHDGEPVRVAVVELHRAVRQHHAVVHLRTRRQELSEVPTL